VGITCFNDNVICHFISIGTLKTLDVISGGFTMQSVQMLFTVCILVWQLVDGRRNDRKI